MSMDPVTELQHLKFTPRTSAWKHMQRFERLCGLAYPRATDAGKWYVYSLVLTSLGLGSR